MPQINPSIPVAGQPNSTEEPKIVSALSALVGAVNTVDAAQIVDGTVTSTEITDGTILPADLQSALADSLGVNVGSTARRARNAPATTEITTSSTTYVTNAADADVSVTQPTLGVTLLIACVDAHGNGSNSVQIGARVDSATDVDLVSTGSASYVTLSAVVAQNRPGTHTYRFVYKVTPSAASFFATRSLCVVTLGF